MKKIKVTAKEVKSWRGLQLSVGESDLYNLLYTREPIAYTCGVYGWNADIYVIDDVTIISGYRSFGYCVPLEIIKKYNEPAKTYVAKYYEGIINNEELKATLSVLLENFINECKLSKRGV